MALMLATIITLCYNALYNKENTMKLSIWPDLDNELQHHGAAYWCHCFSIEQGNRWEEVVRALEANDASNLFTIDSIQAQPQDQNLGYAIEVYIVGELENLDLLQTYLTLTYNAVYNGYIGRYRGMRRDDIS